MKKFLGLCILVGLCFTSVLPVSAEATQQKDPQNTYTIQASPRFKNVHVANFYFEIKDDGKAIVESDAWMYGESDVTLSVDMFYMSKQGVWLIEKRWNDSATNVGEYYFSKTYYVDTDYNYKVMYTYNITRNGVTDKIEKTQYF